MKLLLAVLSLVFAGDALARQTKIIAHGWDCQSASPTDVLACADEFDKTPLDGVSLSIKFTNETAGVLCSYKTMMTDPAWKWSDVEWLVPTLNKIVEHKSLKESLLSAFRCPKKRLDWRDDDAWANFANNMGVLARLAREGGVKGFMIDPEDYPRTRQFYLQGSDGSYEETASLARRRGREVFSAVFKEKPDAVVMAFWLLSTDKAVYNSADPKLAMREMGCLFPAFMDGILDVLPPGALLVDGNESTYRAEAPYGDYFADAARQRRNALSLISPENHGKYRVQHRVGAAFFLDGYWYGPENKWHMPPFDGTRADRLGLNLAAAAEAADYIWLDGEWRTYVPWKRADTPGLHIGKHFLVRPCWEDVIPGFWKQIKSAVKPLETEYGRRVKVASERPLTVNKPRSTVVKGVKYGEIYEVKCRAHEPLAFLRIDWKKDGASKWASRAASVQVVDGRAVFRVPQGVDSFAVVYNQSRCAKQPVEFTGLEVNRLEVLSDEEQTLTAASDELYRYWRLITGSAKAVPVRLRIDSSISKTGNDAYTIVTDSDAAMTFITGSNARSVLYGVYDLLERRGGCGWFWDGDRVPKKAKIDLKGLDVREESKFAYRGVRYFAHRGLSRFQAEHWGLDDWKREIDWCLKKRLNLFMLRIGQDDLFQKAFPGECAYPDASKPLPAQGRRYDNRSLFWPLQFRGELRKEVMKYAFRRGMMAPSDFGTMTHWYSRTPKDFLDNKKPDFLPQAPGAYGEPSGRVWDIRSKKWMDAYWKITDADIREYGRPGLLHTIGIAERHVSTNKAENLAMKRRLTKAIFDEADKRYPEATKLLAGWDLYCMKQPGEVKAFLKNIPEDVIIWDYEADASRNTWFGEWDVIGKRPYTFGVFMAYEAGLDSRTDYAKLAARQKLVADDPMCKGYILWPESSHVDSVGIEWFAKNSWRADMPEVAKVVSGYCSKRYPEEAKAMAELWLKTIPVSTNMQNTWRWNAFLPILREMGEGLITDEERRRWPAPKPAGFFADLPKVAKVLKSLDWEKDEFLKRDMIDIARVWADRLAIDAENAMFTEYFKWLDGDKSAEGRFAELADIAYERLKALASLIALHSDFSICDSYDKLVKIHPISNPGFSSVLVDNVANYYCTSHQAELAHHCYLPAFRYFTDTIKEKMARGDKEPMGVGVMEKFKDRVIAMSFAKLRLDVSRTRSDFNRAIDMVLAAAAYRGGDAFSEECIRAMTIAGFYSPDAKRDLLKDPVWRTRFRTFKSSADDTLQPFYWYDPGVSEKVPLVIALHSWGASVNWSTPATTTLPYCEKNGWAMLYPNFRGGNMRPEACGSDLAVNDILDLIKWAQNERAIDSDRIYIIGGSGGGHFSLLMAGRHPEVFAASVAFCPITDLVRWHADSTLRKNNYAANIVAACGGGPSPTNKEYAARSPLTHLPAARQAGTPIYVATGIHDGHTGSVPVGHSIRAYNILANEADRISEEMISEIENNEAIGEALLFKGNDPLYGEKNKIWMRKDSANVRLTIFEGGHSANYPAGLDFLSRQRRGKPADFSLPSQGAAKIDSVTR